LATNDYQLLSIIMVKGSWFIFISFVWY